MERHHREGARVGAVGGAVPIRYRWVLIQAQHWLWNQKQGLKFSSRAVVLKKKKVLGLGDGGF